MKLKSFGLIEAILGSAIIIVFAVAMSLLSAKSKKTVNDSKTKQEAELIAEDYISRITLLRNVGRVTFDQSKDSSQVVSIDCFASDKGEGCKNQIMDAYPQNQFPFFDMVSDQSYGNYKIVKEEYLKKKKIENKNFKLKSKIEKTNCIFDNEQSGNCREIHVEILWDQDKETKTYIIKQIMSQNL
jgi:hypothetical protein